MKIKIVISLLIISFLAACGDPAPTELVLDDTTVDENYDVEIVSPDPAKIDYLTGYDSTGIVEPVSDFTNVISVSGIKNSFENTTIETGIALAVFFDKSQPVENEDGRIIGYKTRRLGNVFFNNNQAQLSVNRKKMHGKGGKKDTVLGYQHIYSFGTWRPNQQQGRDFPYSNQVQFRLDPVLGGSIEFDIPTPPALNASLQIEKKLKKERVKLNWQSRSQSQIEIIIGGKPKNEEGVFPVYRIHTADDGSFQIPQDLLDEIDKSLYDHLVFTLIRRYRQNYDNKLNDSYVVSQSIHNIGIHFN